MPQTAALVRKADTPASMDGPADADRLLNGRIDIGADESVSDADPPCEGDPNCDTADQNGDGLVDPLDVGFVPARFGPCS